MRAAMLLVEGTLALQQTSRKLLEAAGYLVVTAGSGSEALRLLEKCAYRVLVADLTLSGMDGLTLVDQLRQSRIEVPIMISLGYNRLERSPKAIRHHVHAAIGKPLDPVELLHTVQKCDQRVGATAYLYKTATPSAVVICEPTASFFPLPVDAPAQGQLVRVADLLIDGTRHYVTRAGQHIALSESEYRLLTYLAHRQNHAVSYTELAKHVLDYRCSYEEARELMKTRVWSLRRKIEDDPQTPRYLVTVRGAGYLLRSISLS